MACRQIRPALARAPLAAASLCVAFAAPTAGGQSLCDDFHVPAAHLGNVERCVFDNLSGTTTVLFNDPAILHWERGFNVKPGQHLRFEFGGAPRGAVLNRDLAGGTSLVQGRVSSDGRVMLLNPGGTISIQSGASIEADRGFLASTLEVSDEEALLRGGDVEFIGDGGAGSAIDNRGTVRAPGGDVFLISGSINNFAGGRLLAPNGDVRLATGTRVRMFSDGGAAGRRIEVLEGAGSHSILNFGHIEARDAVELAAFDSDGPVVVGDRNPQIENWGTVRTTADDGRVFLRVPGGGQVLNSPDGRIETAILAVDPDTAIVNDGVIVLTDDGSNPAPPSGARQFPRLSSGDLSAVPSNDFRLARLSFSHLNGLESNGKPSRAPQTGSTATNVALRGAAAAAGEDKKPKSQPKKIILRRGGFFGKKTS